MKRGAFRVLMFHFSSSCNIAKLEFQRHGGRGGDKKQQHSDICIWKELRLNLPWSISVNDHV